MKGKVDFMRFGMEKEEHKKSTERFIAGGVKSHSLIRVELKTTVAQELSKGEEGARDLESILERKL